MNDFFLPEPALHGQRLHQPRRPDFNRGGRAPHPAGGPAAQAPNIAVLHNHPSGNPQPSRTDDALTEKLRNAAEIMDIHLVDHIVVGEDTYYSYNETGKL